MNTLNKKIYLWVFPALWLFATIVAAELAYRIYKGAWYFQERARSSRGMVQIHPYFGACLVPNKKDIRNGVTISHNSLRCRGPETVIPKPKSTLRIVTLGGSSTYCVSVSDNETWPHYLQKKLAGNFEVVNLGGPGGTSLETLVQSCLLFSELEPNVAIYYLGWNDARVQHVKSLWADYSDSHGKWVTSFGLSGRDLSSPFAIGYLFRRAAFHYVFPDMDSEKVLHAWQASPDALTEKIDERAMSLYRRNLRLIISVCRAQRVVPVFVPQIMNNKVLTSTNPYGWLPFVRDRDLPKVIQAYNSTMEAVSKEQNVWFASEVQSASFDEKDFVDQGHFTASGNSKFAQALKLSLANSGLRGVAMPKGE